MTIAVVGSSNFDFAAKVAKLPTQGQTVVSHNYRTGPGGKGCNQAFAVARLGVPPIFISKIGDDLLGRQLLETLTLEGLDTTNMVVANEAQTGIALISIDDAGENMITVVGGANMTMSRSDLHERQACLRDCDYLLLQLECPVVAVDCAIKYAREGQAKIILDPAPVADLVVMRDLLALTHIVTPNQSECSALTGIAPIDEHSARAASDKLHEMGPETVVLKMGGAVRFIHQTGKPGWSRALTSTRLILSVPGIALMAVWLSPCMAVSHFMTLSALPARPAPLPRQAKVLQTQPPSGRRFKPDRKPRGLRPGG